MNVRGQDEAIETVVSSLTSEMAIARPGQLLGSFLLVGPTGTGKTFLSQLVGQALYPDSESVILRMNQYKSQNDVQTLLVPLRECLATRLVARSCGRCCRTRVG